MASYFQVTRGFLIKASFVLLLAIGLGVAHGLYVSANASGDDQYYYAKTLCHGVYEESPIRVSELGSRILINYKVVIPKGEVTFRLVDPDGEIVYERTDDKPIFRQHAVTANSMDKLGDWSFVIDCKKADMEFELEVDIVKE
ncbi:MAG: hypothetical protein ACOC32_00885 [Nanoarchaeota archaeon]